MPNVDAVVQARIAEARQRREQRRQQRAELDEARRYGLAARHRTKLRRNRTETDEETS